MSHIKLTNAETGHPYYMPDSWAFGVARKAPNNTPSGSWISRDSGPVQSRVDFVTETPAEIAAMIESARREERIRENAARIHSALHAAQYAGKQLRWDMLTDEQLHKCAYAEAKDFVDAGDEFFAAERARKEGEKP